MLFLADQAMIFVVPAVMALVLGLRYGLHVMDKGRITEAARAKGWQDVTVQWAPFAPGWLFEKGERHYRVSYRDGEGRHCLRHCKTGLLTGVFWRDEVA